MPCAAKASRWSRSIRRIDDLAAQLHAAKPDVVFNALHGRWGEDGCVQGLLELLRMPYTHSGVLASALAMHKQRAKDVFRAAGLPVVKSIVVDRREAGARHLMEPPYVVKPVNEGSVGRRLHHPQGRQPPAGGAGHATEWDLSERDDGRGIRARPRTDGCRCMGGKALAVTEITTELAFYDYEAKYAAGGSQHVVPAEIPAAVAEEAMRAGRARRMRRWAAAA